MGSAKPQEISFHGDEAFSALQDNTDKKYWKSVYGVPFSFVSYTVFMYLCVSARARLSMSGCSPPCLRLGPFVRYVRLDGGLCVYASINIALQPVITYQRK